jgi:aminopeptidase N
MLRQRLGDEAFFGGARAFLDAHRYRGGTTEDLRAALEAAGERDLGVYFDRWVYGMGLPEVRWAAETVEAPDGFRTTVHVRPRDLPGALPLEIKVKTEGAQVVRRVELEPAGGTWILVSREPVRHVGINEDLAILADLKKVSRPGQLAQR